MLWRRSDNVVFALLLGGAGLVAVGDGVECRVKGILQVRVVVVGGGTLHARAECTAWHC